MTLAPPNEPSAEPLWTLPNRNGGVAIWRQIAETLRGELARGLLRAGDRLPAEDLLADRFSVNRHTVRRAIATLVESGHLRVERGRGTFVSTPVIDYAIGTRTRLTQNLRAQGREPSRRLLDRSLEPASAIVAEALDLTLGAPVLRVVTVSDADRVPISLATHWLPIDRIPGIEAAYDQTASVTEALAACGIPDYVRLWTRLMARLPDDREAQMLAQAPNRPILQSEGVDADTNGRRLQVVRTLFAGDRVQFLLGDSDRLGNRSGL